MSAAEWTVAAAGLAVIVAINWYFFAPREAAAATGTGAEQRVEITVRGGYEPGAVRAKRGVPLTLVFDRQEESSCSEEVVLAEFGIRKHLPAFERTEIRVTPDKAGTFDITCGMAMLHGKLIVED